MSIIETGVGNGGYKAKVTEESRLHTSSVVITEDVLSTKNGRSFNLSTGLITLTNDSQTALLYIKNDEADDLIIDSVEIGFNTSTGGSATDMIEIYSIRTPTDGTLVSDATAIDIKCNRNMGEPFVLSVDAFKGVTGSTLTNGIDHSLTFMKPFSIKTISTTEILPKGSAIGYKVTPPSGNTSVVMYISVLCYLRNKEL